MTGLTDVDVISTEVRNFANAGTGYDDSALQGLLAPRGCASGLPGCKTFTQADQEVTTRVMELSTQVEHLLNGVRQGARKMAQLYDDTDQAVYAAQQNAANLNDVAPRERGLPTVDPDLLTGQAAAQTADRLDTPS
jgi:hypothetical protein